MNLQLPLCDFEGAKYLLFSNNVPPLAYYSHLPIFIISFALGVFILLKGRKNLPNQILFTITSAFSLWVFLDSIFWASNRSDVIMLVWSLQILFEPLVHASSLYLIYVLTNKKDAPFFAKVGAFLLYLPVIIFVPTGYSLSGFDVPSCLSVEGPIALYYTYFIEITFSLWLTIFCFRKYQSIKDAYERRKLVYLAIGTLLLLFAFSSGNIASSFSEDWRYAQIGLFTMPLFMGFLVYSIVRFKTFDIKLFSTQALVVALIILIGSQFFFIQNNTNKILNSITFILSAVFGYYLVRSVKIEVKRKEQLQHMTNELTDANDKLRKLDNTKSEFISIASHQLRTPLTAIGGYGSMLLEGFYGKLDSKQHDAINKIYQSNTRLINLVEDLLDVSRIESGRMEFKFEKCKLEDICQEIYEMFLVQAKEHGLSFKMDTLKEPLPKVMIDGEKIKEVVSNLVDNAIKYTLQGGLTMSLSQRDDFVRLTVSDTGIGIPQDEIPYLFAKFSRGKDISRLNASGTGLGLYVGKSIVEANHGKIWIESEGAGKGSKFVLELPVG